MELQDSIKKRRSIRHFKSDKVPMERINEIVEKAVYAPSWKNTQVTRYYAITNEVIKEKIREGMPAFNHQAMNEAPVIVVSTVIKNRSGYTREGEFDTPKGKGWQMYDCGLSNMIFCLAAQELGLGTVIMGYYDQDIITKVLEIPDTQEVVSVIAIGYPDEEPMMPNRKGTDIILKLVE